MLSCSDSARPRGHRLTVGPWSKASHLLATIAVLVSAVIMSSTGVAAAHCDSEGDATRRGSTATGRGQRCGHGGGGSDDPSPGSSEEDRWNAYCAAVAGSYRDGNSVSITQQEQVTGTTVIYSLGFGGHAGSSPQIERITVPTSARYFVYDIGCRTPTGLTVRTLVLPEGAVPVSPIALRNQVFARITIPDPSLAANPPLDDPDRFSVVNLPTWLWIDDPWLPITDSASQSGVSVSVTATPTAVTWDTGDGESTSCADAGTAWTPGAVEGSTSCSHTYRRASAGRPGDAYQLSATVHWVFTWTLNGTPQGQFATYDPSTTVTHQVGEIQAVET